MGHLSHAKTKKTLWRYRASFIKKHLPLFTQLEVGLSQFKLSDIKMDTNDCESHLI